MGKAVLVADDDASTRFVLSRALDHLGCEVVVTEDGTDVPELVATHRFDLLVIDLYMPGLNGFGILRRIRQPDPGFLPVPLTLSTVPVLVVSGEGHTASIANAKALGANDYLVKPVDVDLFETTVQRLLSSETVSRIS